MTGRGILVTGGAGYIGSHVGRQLGRRRRQSEQDRLDGLINYESILLSLNRGGQLREPLALIRGCSSFRCAGW